MSDCIFCKIASGDIPAKKAFEDDDMVVFHDINPVAPVHLLAIPKRHIASLADARPEDALVMGKLLQTGARLAVEHGCTDGFRTLVNTGRVGRQEVYHLHIHFVGGPDVLPPMLKR
ncbi:MAG TPA: histidine triad nucleotide-binding protein [Denitromonas sp.]|mgnify:CR=1 FL=1|uniref:histidine triad nucleotide-binding protein n=1 Tax=Denitromonas sp. TaxID=2734609 RepID=UPI001E00921A|nr:histidine triad nucleotide-binding protein [Rhodocyclaceae bacterium]HQU87235.1 histidine triad nucleotide-binding protein [Denitromonas sp.]HQV13983.1 histidine triad nucleotide-binding protein [Denitromonas sp.]